MRLSTPFSAAVVLLSLALRTSAHGFPFSVSIDGKNYPGANGPSASGNSPFRKVSSGNPVTSPNSNDLICGLDAKKASSSASAKPGSVMKFTWGAMNGGNWFHVVGPIITYMAKCSGDCSSFSPESSTEWFKIDQQGETTPGNSNTWVQKNLVNGSPITVKIPNNLASGNYLVRHEIIAVHNAVSLGGTEFYPSCVQVKVGGNGSGQPDRTVHFPGAYKATDPGILGDFYTPSTKYTFPGGKVATISGSSSSGNSDSDSDSEPTSSTKKTKTASSTKSTALSASTPVAIANPAASPTSTKAAANPASTGRCKKRRVRCAADNATETDGTSRRALRFHRKRFTSHELSF